MKIYNWWFHSLNWSRHTSIIIIMLWSWVENPLYTAVIYKIQNSLQASCDPFVHTRAPYMYQTPLITIIFKLITQTNPRYFFLLIFPSERFTLWVHTINVKYQFRVSTCKDICNLILAHLRGLPYVFVSLIVTYLRNGLQ